MEINLNADPTFRKMVADEVRAALLTDTNGKVTQGVQEGIRRALGNGETKITNVVVQEVKATLAQMRIKDVIHSVVRELVVQEAAEQIRTAAREELKKHDVATVIKDKLAALKIHVSVG